jgi:hypothetical protein
MLMTLNKILSADADIGRGSRMRVRIKTLRMQILLFSSAQGSNYKTACGFFAKENFSQGVGCSARISKGYIQVRRITAQLTCSVLCALVPV